MLLSEMNQMAFKRVCRAAWVPVMALVLTTLVVGACGFRPLYGKHDDVKLPTEQYLARISIDQISDRIGQQLRNNLLSRLTPKGQSAEPLYKLSISVSQAISNLGIKKSAVVTRGNLRVSAAYSMTLLRGTDPSLKGLTTGNVLSTSSYDIPQDQFAARAALKDAQTRAVKEIADDIKIRLAVYFQQIADKL